jgi:predicted GH43/DUF377 family glycosyl hydrolase
MYYLGTRTDPDGQERDYMGIANSPDLLHWADATSGPVLPRRPGAFDSRVMESGPPPMVTRAGILPSYNGASDSLVYGPAWALFDREDPSKLIARADRPFLLPELDWEKRGVVPNVIFLEGAIVNFPSEGELEGTAHYGAADHVVGAVENHDSMMWDEGQCCVSQCFVAGRVNRAGRIAAAHRATAGRS